MKVLRIAVVLCALAAPAAAQTPAAVEGDFVARDFTFQTGETLPELKLHYRTLGTPRRDASGIVRNAVMILHGTGGNGIMRTMIMDSIKNDPAWKNGEYTERPRAGLVGAVNILMMMTSSPIGWHRTAPTRDAADKWYEDQVKSRVAATDANDMLYWYNASRDYDPSANLEKITAALLAINSADDVVNPPELGLMEKLIPRVKRGRYILLPTTEQTRGHGTHSMPAIWGHYLDEFLKNLEPR